MATVYLARDLKHDRDVALKVLLPELASVLGADRFLQEIRISARLDHPHILTLIDSGDSDGVVWYVLPYVRGETLRARLIREKQLSIEETLRIAAQVAGALDYAHRQGVIHRDIKPENILLHEGEAVVADFGIALAVREAGGERLTQTGLSLGTPQYMSPEQATGDGALDARTDVYSLGAMVYEMLAGEPPITGPTAHAVIAKLLTERPTRLRTVRDTVPLSLDTAVAKALAKVPADRFASAGEFLAALQQPVAPPPVAPRRILPIALALAGVAVLVVVAAVLWQSGPPPPSAPAPNDVPSVAVLPFDNLTGNPGDQYLSDGMTEEVIGQLAKVGDLKVISRTSTEALKGTRLTMRQIAETLGVRHILEGSVRHAANRIRVTVNLIDAHTDANVWSSAYDRDLADVFAVQEEIARQVVDSLVSTVGVRPVLSGVARTGNPQAYEAYQVGRYQLQRRTGPGLQGALERFEEAIRHDSTYAPALASLANVYVLMGFYGYPGVDFYAAYGRAWWLADRAIALDPALAEGHAVRGVLMALAWGPAEGIAADFSRALTLRPNSPDVHLYYAPFLSRQDRHEEALAVARRADALDPLAPGPKIGLAYSGLAARRLDVVVQEAARAAALEPGLMRPRAFQALGDLLSGHPERCLTQELGPYVGVRALCLYSTGNVREAALLADSLGAAFTAMAAGNSTYSPVLVARSLAQYYAWIGDVEESLAWLERAYALSPVGEDFIVIASAIYDRVRADPRFQAGLQRLHVQIYDRVRSARRAAEPE
jgi:serine/threonine protein kinase/tetratricopeptide (TPR) repeat protein